MVRVSIFLSIFVHYHYITPIYTLYSLHIAQVCLSFQMLLISYAEKTEAFSPIPGRFRKIFMLGFYHC